MRDLTSSLFAILVLGVTTLPASAQQIDNTVALPDALPGECYAKVRTAPVYEVKIQEVVLEEASERIETVEAEYEIAEKQVLVKDSTKTLAVIDTAFKTSTERFEVRPAVSSWTSTTNGVSVPASADALQLLASSGVDLGAFADGACFTEYVTEAQYETRTRQVKVKEAIEKITIVPAQYETVQKQVEKRAASTKVIAVPAMYRIEEVSILVEPARDVWQQCSPSATAGSSAAEVMCRVRLPDRYETQTRTVLETPAGTKTVDVPAVYETVEVQRLVEPASEVREEVPAEYESVSRQVKVADPEFFWLAKDVEPEEEATPTGRVICQELTPAQYTTVERQVVSEPAKTTTSVTPAQYTTIAVEKQVTPASELRIAVPARTRETSSRVQTAPAQLDWRQVVCEPDMTRERVAAVQQALNDAGFSAGAADGIAGRGTLDALEKFQEENGLGTGGMTYEALELLEVELPPDAQADTEDD